MVSVCWGGSLLASSLQKTRGGGLASAWQVRLTLPTPSSSTGWSTREIRTDGLSNDRINATVILRFLHPKHTENITVFIVCSNSRNCKDPLSGLGDFLLYFVCVFETETGPTIGVFTLSYYTVIVQCTSTIYVHVECTVHLEAVDIRVYQICTNKEVACQCIRIFEG